MPSSKKWKLFAIAFYFLFITCHFLPVTSYFLLATCYILLVTLYFLLVTFYSVHFLLRTCYFLCVTRYFLLVTRYDNWQKFPNPYYFMKTPFYCLPLPRFQILSNPPPHLRSFCYLVSSAECVILLQLICYFPYFFLARRGEGSFVVRGRGWVEGSQNFGALYFRCTRNTH